MAAATPARAADRDPDGRLAANIMHFARVLRRAGVPAGPGRVVEAVRAVEAVGVARRADFYWALHAVLVSRRDQRELFDQAFHAFWRNPRILERMLALVLPQNPGLLREDDAPEPMSRRLAEALGRGKAPPPTEPDGDAGVAVDAAMTWSRDEVPGDMDFEKMSAEELARAREAVARMRLPIMQVPTRRYRASGSGERIDMRNTLRALMRGGGGTIPLRRKSRQRRRPPLVMLCDISGSMSRYSRMLLHFMHAVTGDRDRVHAFLFGTRLTNITRHLRHRDVDLALDRVSEAVGDWSGGTRIGSCLADFNRTWSRRVLGQGAIVLLISDGLDRDGGEGLDREMERLHKSCRRLVWLNPLLRYDGYEARSLGARIILPHVDDFRTVHNLDSLTGLTDALSRMGRRRAEGAAAVPARAA